MLTLATWVTKALAPLPSPPLLSLDKSLFFSVSDEEPQLPHLIEWEEAEVVEVEKMTKRPQNP